MPEFRETLPPHERHFVGRFESFGDIVVGFSLSELALQFALPKSGPDLVADPVRYLAFFATFTIVAQFWMRFHRVMASGFAPYRLDLGLAFAYLAFVALVPYSLLAMLHLGSAGFRYSLGLYIALMLALTTTNLCLMVLALRRAWRFLDDGRRRVGWKAVVVTGALAPMLAAAMAADVATGWQAAVEILTLMWFVVLGGSRLLRAPRPGWLGIDDGTFAPNAVS